jgi:phosphoserine phosphatase RsbU/P
MARLIVQQHPSDSRVDSPVEIDKLPFLIGRDVTCCHLVLDPQRTTVSRKHAEITANSGTFFIKDLKSRNKTYVDGKEIQPELPFKLADGQKIVICDYVFQFKAVVEAGVEEPEDDELPDVTTTIESVVQHTSNRQLMESQPAEKLRAILSITNTLTKSLDLAAIYPKIADELLNLFKQADRCLIIEYNQSIDRLQPRFIKARRQNDRSDQFSKTIIKNCLTKLEAFLSEDVSSDGALGMAQSIADIKIRSVMCAPLASSDNKPLGVIQLDTLDKSRKFTKGDLELLVCVGNQAAVAIENARMASEIVKKAEQEKDFKTAQELQIALLPKRYPDLDGYQFFKHYSPAKSVGGDYFDFISLPLGKHAILLGDVSGKGIPAALMMARVSGDARVCMLSEPHVTNAITRLNEILIEADLQDRYITLMASVLDPKAHHVTIVNAGHGKQFIYRAKNDEIEVTTQESAQGFPVGWVPGYEYESSEITLDVGDTLIFFTDGVTDAESANGDRFNEEGVLQSLAKLKGQNPTPQLIGETLLADVRKFISNHPQFDDIAIVCFGRVETVHTSIERVSAESEMVLESNY